MDQNDYTKTQAIAEQIRELGWEIAEEHRAFYFEVFAYRSDPGNGVFRHATKNYVGDIHHGIQYQRSWEQLLADVRANDVIVCPPGAFPNGAQAPSI